MAHPADVLVEAELGAQSWGTKPAPCHLTRRYLRKNRLYQTGKGNPFCEGDRRGFAFGILLSVHGAISGIAKNQAKIQAMAKTNNDVKAGQTAITEKVKEFIINVYGIRGSASLIVK